jgi:hypothetical protein
MKLEECRKNWEKGLTQKMALFCGPDKLIVVLKSGKRDGFRCHRYFTIGDNWDVSVDFGNASFEEVLRWIEREADRA